MPEFTYPGVYREQVQARRVVTRGISPSNNAVVGFFKKGPVNQPTLVGSPGEQEAVFGGVTAKSLAPSSLNWFFGNGGQQAFVVRTVGQNAAPATAYFSEKMSDVFLEPVAYGSPALIEGQLLDDAGLPPYLVPGSVRFYWSAGVNEEDYDPGIETTLSNQEYSFTIPAAIQDVSLFIEYYDSGNSIVETITANPMTGQLSGLTATGTVNFATGEVSLDLNGSSVSGGYFRVAYTRIPVSEEIIKSTDSVDGAKFYCFNLGAKHIYLPSLVISLTNSDGDPVVITSDNNGVLTDGDSNPQGSVDRITGTVNLVLGYNSALPGSVISSSFRTLVMTELFDSPVDNNAGRFEGPLVTFPPSGFIAYENFNGSTRGEFRLPLALVPLDEGGTFDLYVDYEYYTHRFEATNPGVSGNDLRVSIQGDANYLDESTGTYTRFNLFIDEETDGNGQFLLADTFRSLNIADISDVNHISKRINDPFDGSDLINVASPFSESVPGTLRGKVRTNVIVDIDSTGPDYILKLCVDPGEIVPGSIEIKYIADGDTEESIIVDDRAGGLTGDLDLSQEASVDYATGIVSFYTDGFVATGQNLTISYVTSPISAAPFSDFTGGLDGSGLTRLDVTDPSLEPDKLGMYALKKIPEEQIMITIPDFAGDPVAERAQLAYAEARGNAMVLLAPPKGSSVRDAVNYKRRVLLSNSNRGAMYYPWLVVRDPVTQGTITVPPHGHVAGIWARTDSRRNVGKSPGGIEDGLLNIVLGPEIELDGEQVGALKDANINALWAPPRNELCVWGVRTLEPEGEGDYLYINSRRTVDYTATIVAANLWWVVFENNDPTLRTRVKEQVLQILRRGFTAGLYKGASEEEAFELLVPTPEQGGPQNLFDVEIGVAVNDPAEFVRVKIRKLLS